MKGLGFAATLDVVFSVAIGPTPLLIALSTSMLSKIVSAMDMFFVQNKIFVQWRKQNQI